MKRSGSASFDKTDAILTENRNKRSKPSGGTIKGAKVNETAIGVSSRDHKQVQFKRSEVDVEEQVAFTEKPVSVKSEQPLSSNKQAAAAARDLKFGLVVDTEHLLQIKFAKHQRDRILANLVHFKQTEVKNQLEECLKQLHIQVKSELVELVRGWHKGMLQHVYTDASRTQYKALDNQFLCFLRDLHDKLDDHITTLRTQCIHFLHYAYGDLDSDSSESDSDDTLVLSPQVGSRPSVVFPFKVPRYDSLKTEDSDDDDELMEDVPKRRKYSAFPTIPGRLYPPKPVYKFGEGLFAEHLRHKD